MSGASENPRIANPELRLEDVRGNRHANICHGRGRKTAAARGYNAELLANAVLGSYGRFLRYSDRPWVDTFVEADMDYSWYDVEVKSCVDRYQKQNGDQGRYGMFRIWKPHHDELLEATGSSRIGKIYFFIVYTVDDGIEKEVGKLIAPVRLVDSVLDNWSTQEHATMGVKKTRQISWRLLLKRLNVSKQRFEDTHIIDLTNE
jgi:hypothetical protein